MIFAAAQRLVTCCALALAATLCACASAPVALDDEQARLAEAHRLAQSAQALAKAGQRDKAVEQYAQAVATHREFAPAWYNLGVLLAEQGKHAQAAEAYSAAAEYNLTDPRPHTGLGLIAQELLHYDEAADYYAMALERDPNYLPALRKSIEIDQLRDSYSDETVQRVRRALYRETDQQWKDYLLRQKLKADERLSRGKE
jgi:tetratricopeptide (TPR) repeat protein